MRIQLNDKGKPRLKRICKDCNKKYTPTGRGDTLCAKCFYKKRAYKR